MSDPALERIALALFATDERVVGHDVRLVGDYAAPGRCRPVLGGDPGRRWRALFVDWCRDENGWRTEAMRRAQAMVDVWGGE